MHVIRRSCQQKEEERGRRGSKGGGYWWTFFSFSFSNGIQNAMHGVFASSLLDEMFSVVGGFDWFLFFCRTVPSTKGGGGTFFYARWDIIYTSRNFCCLLSVSRLSLSLSHTHTQSLSLLSPSHEELPLWLPKMESTISPPRLASTDKRLSLN